jgi:hypothetical protein
MLPDGTVRVTNVGTTQNPIIVAAPNTPKERMLSTTPEERQTMEEFARALGVGEDSIAGFVEAWDQSARDILEAPKRELLYRLNSQVQGIDPGEPVNWPGMRAFR